MNTKIISRYLQLLRKTNHYTQDDLAARLDISRQAISKWETGTAIPDIEILLELSKIYGVTINDLLEPKIQPQKITDFEQISSIPKNELREILEQIDIRSLTIALMGASPKLNHLIEKLFPDIDFGGMRHTIGRIRIEVVENMQNEIISLINLHFIDAGIS